MRERSDLHICPVCTEEKSIKKFMKKSLFSSDDGLPAHIYNEKAIVTYSDEKGSYTLTAEAQKLLKPLRIDIHDGDELDFKLLQNYTLCPFLKVR